MNNILLNKISNSIHSKINTVEAYLYGSRARGDERMNSDWDILILINDDKVTNEIEDIYRDDLYGIELESGQSISTLIYSNTYWNSSLVYSPLYKNILNEGIKI